MQTCLNILVESDTPLYIQYFMTISKKNQQFSQMYQIRFLNSLQVI